MYKKIFKWAMIVLMLIGAALTIYGYATNFTVNDGAPVDYIFYWSYLMLGIAIAAMFIVGLVIAAINDPKSLIKIGVYLIAAVAIIAVVYFTASGDPAMGMLGKQPSDTILKLTDTILNLTYLIAGVAALVIVGGIIYTTVLKNK